MLAIPAQIDTKSPPSPCRQGAGGAHFSLLISDFISAFRFQLSAFPVCSPRAGAAQAKPPSCAPTVKSDFLAIMAPPRRPAGHSALKTFSFAGISSICRNSLFLIGLTLAGSLSVARADATYQPLAGGPFTQNWSNADLINANDDWFGFPGIIGYRGDDLTTVTGTDPRTVTAESMVVDVNANQTAPNTYATGGVTEFALADPVVALTGSNTADAPYIQIHLDTTGTTGISIQYNLRDLDGSTDNAIQPIALQYRVGSTGAFADIPAAYVADATDGPSSATLVTAVSATLPAAAENQSQVQVRIITTNAAGNDEWVGIDDISISGTLVPALTRIHVIQGSGDTSPLTGQTINTEGIVTGFFKGTSGAREGFYLQDPVGDGDPATSDGLCVFAGSSGAPLAALQVGDLVNVSGTVAEDATNTRLNSTGFSVVSSGNSLPEAVQVTLPFPTLTHPERFEGMLITLGQTLTVTNNFFLGRFGEVSLSSGGLLPQPTHIALPGAAALAVLTANNLNRIILDDGSSQQYPDPTPYLFGGATPFENTLRGGDTIAGATGVLDSSPAGWRVQPTATPVFVRANPRSAPPSVGGNLKVAGINAYNFFTELGLRGATNASEFDRQRAHLVAALASIDADIYGLNELQNNGYGTGSAIATLVTALNAAVTNGSVYAFVSHTDYPTPPSADEIKCGFIYKTNTLELVGNSVFNADPIFSSTSRLPLAQTFRKSSNGEKITVCVNHFKSRGSVGSEPLDNDQGDGQGVGNYTRTQQSQALAAWLATFPTGDSDPDILIIGNLNAYAKEDPITTLASAGYTNLTERDAGAGEFSFSFDGQWGPSDHALASSVLATRVIRAEPWRCNSPEPAILDYNTEFKSANQQFMNPGATPWRFSDHDPILIGINLDSPSPLQTWRTLHGLASDGSHDLASAAGDGVANLLKYAFNMAPNAGDLPRMNVSVLAPGGDSGLPRIFRDGNGRLVVEFVRRKAATNPGINYQVQTGEDPSNLQPLDLTGATFAYLDTTWERVTVTDPAVTAKRFGRLSISTFVP